MRPWQHASRSTSAVHTITDARSRMSADINYRQRRYLISMAIRTACFLVAVLAPLPLSLRLVAFAGAIVLPYIAVVFANGGREPEQAAEFSVNRTGTRKPQPMDGDQSQIEP